MNQQQRRYFQKRAEEIKEKIKNGINEYYNNILAETSYDINKDLTESIKLNGIKSLIIEEVSVSTWRGSKSVSITLTDEGYKEYKEKEASYQKHKLTVNKNRQNSFEKLEKKITEIIDSVMFSGDEEVKKAIEYLSELNVASFL